jgi:hypothetical protein
MQEKRKREKIVRRLKRRKSLALDTTKVKAGNTSGPSVARRAPWNLPHPIGTLGPAPHSDLRVNAGDEFPPRISSRFSPNAIFDGSAPSGGQPEQGRPLAAGSSSPPSADSEEGTPGDAWVPSPSLRERECPSISSRFSPRPRAETVPLFPPSSEDDDEGNDSDSGAEPPPLDSLRANLQSYYGRARSPTRAARLRLNSAAIEHGLIADDAQGTVTPLSTRKSFAASGIGPGSA